jgi:ribosomal protein S14
METEKAMQRPSDGCSDCGRTDKALFRTNEKGVPGIFEYLREGKVVAALRTVWFTLILGYIREACQECGRPYLLWWSDDALYAKVTGHGRFTNGEAAPGLWCLECFSRKAESIGIWIRWEPHDTSSSDEISRMERRSQHG